MLAVIAMFTNECADRFNVDVRHLMLWDIFFVWSLQACLISNVLLLDHDVALITAVLRTLWEGTCYVSKLKNTFGLEFQFGCTYDCGMSVRDRTTLTVSVCVFQ